MIFSRVRATTVVTLYIDRFLRPSCITKIRGVFVHNK